MSQMKTEVDPLGVDDLPCFIAFYFYDPCSNVKFHIIFADCMSISTIYSFS